MTMKAKIGKCLGVLASITVCVIAFLFIYNANRFTGYTGDDFLYHFVYRGAWPTKYLSEYHNPWDWMVAIYIHMTQWNARLTSIIFEIAAMQVDKSVFNVISSVAYVLLGVLMNFIASGKRVFFRPLPLAVTFLLMWFCLPGFGSTILWVSGASNYLLPSVLMMVYFALFRFNYHVKKFPQVMFYLMILFGIFVGMSNEVGSSTAMIVVFLFIHWNRRIGSEDINMEWQIFSLVAGVLSFVAMIALSSSSAETSNYGESEGKIAHVLEIIENTFSYSGMLLLPIAALLFVILFNRRSIFGKERPAESKITLYGGMYFLVAALAGCGAMIASPILPARLWFMTNLFLLVSLLMLIQGWQDYRERHVTTNMVLIIGTLAVMFFAIPSYQYNMKDIKKSFDVFYTHELVAKESKGKNEAVTKMPGLEPTTNPDNAYDGTPYITPGDPAKQWVNVWMAKYWGLNAVGLDNSVPVQHTPQKDLAFVTFVEQTYDKYLGKFQKKYFPVEHESIKKDEKETAIQAEKDKYGDDPQADNSNLPKDKPWLRNALIRYVNVETKKIVGVEKITSPYNEKYDISHAATSGYQTLSDNPKSYTFTQATHQTIDINVKPKTQKITLYFNKEHEVNGKAQSTLVSTTTIEGRTGEDVLIEAPVGYTIQGKKEVRYEFPIENPGVKDIVVTPIPIGEILKEMKSLHLILIGMALFIFYDIVLGLRIGDKEAKARLRM